MRLPSLPPAGTLALRRLVCWVRPEPPQVGQGSSMIWPAPPHCGQGWLIEKRPCPCDSTPRPSQRGQVVGEVPGLAPPPLQVAHRAAFGTVTLIWAPLIAWSKLSETSVSRSRPRTCWAWGRPLPRLNMPPRMSPKSKLPNPPACPAPEPAPPNGLPPPKPPKAPASSYSLRFSGSPRTSWAAEISLNFSSASLSPGLRSGWYFRASFRYAFLISSSVAFFETPNVL